MILSFSFVKSFSTMQMVNISSRTCYPVTMKSWLTTMYFAGKIPVTESRSHRNARKCRLSSKPASPLPSFLLTIPPWNTPNQIIRNWSLCLWAKAVRDIVWLNLVHTLSSQKVAMYMINLPTLGTPVIFPQSCYIPPSILTEAILYARARKVISK